MTNNRDFTKALKSWKNSELTEVSEAPILLRIAGLVMVSVSAALAILM